MGMPTKGWDEVAVKDPISGVGARFYAESVRSPGCSAALFVRGVNLAATVAGRPETGTKLTAWVSSPAPRTN
jgi:hypothetical protein